MEDPLSLIDEIFPAALYDRKNKREYLLLDKQGNIQEFGYYYHDHYTKPKTPEPKASVTIIYGRNPPYIVVYLIPNNIHWHGMRPDGIQNTNSRDQLLEKIAKKAWELYAK